jgi:eukaryotic-like serine/threonine-protein kinase
VVTGVLGSGAMGVVLAARDPDLDRMVAIKLLKPDAFPAEQAAEARERLLREARAMAKLSHPNVVAVHEVGVDGDQVFVAMEYVQGTTLTRWLQAEPRTWRQILVTFLQAARGLSAVHGAGLVHRDFKPDNVLIDARGVVRVSDFGLVGAPRRASPPSGGAAPALDGLTRTGAVMGTPIYMAPEQHAAGPTDPRTDQFSFCVALYEALYGRRPFAGNSYAELATSVLEGRLEPPPPSDVPPWLAAVVSRGMSVDPAARFMHLDALIFTVNRELAPPPARRRPGLIIALSVGAVLLVVALVVGGLAIMRFGDRRRARQESEQMAVKSREQLLDVRAEAAAGKLAAALRIPLMQSAFTDISEAVEAAKREEPDLRFTLVLAFNGERIAGAGADEALARTVMSTLREEWKARIARGDATGKISGLVARLPDRTLLYAEPITVNGPPTAHAAMSGSEDNLLGFAVVGR